MNKVIYHKRVIKALKKLPIHIAKNLQRWGEIVEEIGIEETRKIKGYHDEPLSGDRDGQRSIRLSRAYRAFYIEYEAFGEDEKEIIDIVHVEEVNKHEY
ncbi:MAG: type II toxin-antitoxin system mRNA interferase toxin, RelE/StbE family [Proteobacteria bacterium]|nr:type II toxin-antitoxin system mRNA interferase toxin, RelE/StbE family [Pseudomonadota bacterium]